MTWNDILEGIKSLIVPAIVIVAIFWRFLLPPLLRRYIKNAEKKGDKCDCCKGKMLVTRTFLYLIPSSFDHEHEWSAEYYIKYATPIENETQIPTGNKACRMHVLQCQGCSHREVRVVDFLKVREEEIMKGSAVFPYEKFEAFLYQ